ncbi:Rab family GTPase [Candidatus Borrarchaeum sp.]|uniref:Rab family GTPase n=1 Tax=Candidatus Borrarchaeum sp. TaxID=2846742 RepID=UPI002580A838|nr:Rab family GTPase [Candidatus Borrarchaeum sp.]
MAAVASKEEYYVKVVVAGDGGVGKTSLLNRYVSNTFLEVMKITIGAGFYSEVIETEDRIVTLQLWDFGGEKRFRFILPSYCKGAHGVILAFDMNDFTTLINLDEWLAIIRENTKKPSIFLVGTKSDIAGIIDNKFIQDYLAKNKLKKFIPTSAKTGDNVGRIFQELTQDILATQTLSK